MAARAPLPQKSNDAKIIVPDQYKHVAQQRDERALQELHGSLNLLVKQVTSRHAF